MTGHVDILWISRVHKMYNCGMNDIDIIRLRELGQLDQMGALLLDMLSEARLATERRAINLRLQRVERLKRLWQPKGSNRDAVHERKRHQ